LQLTAKFWKLHGPYLDDGIALTPNFHCDVTCHTKLIITSLHTGHEKLLLLPFIKAAFAFGA
jgi:hypothetical protein